MARELKRIDVSRIPELARIAEEVRDSREPRILILDNEDLALVVPLRPASKLRRRRARTKADWEAFRSSAGSWRGIIDVETFIAHVYESRRLSSRPPVEL